VWHPSITMMEEGELKRTCGMLVDEFVYGGRPVPDGYAAKDGETVVDMQGEGGVSRRILMLDIQSAAMELIWLAIRDEAEDRGVSRKDFLRSLSGDAASDAAAATHEAAILYLPQKKREPIRAMIRHARMEADRQYETAMREVAKLDGLTASDSPPCPGSLTGDDAR